MMHTPPATPENPHPLPDPKNITTFAYNAYNPIELIFDHLGGLYYFDIYLGNLHRITYGNTPIVQITANSTSGTAPLTVFLSTLEGTYDPENGSLSYAWDL